MIENIPVPKADCCLGANKFPNPPPGSNKLKPPTEMFARRFLMARKHEAP